MNEEEKDFLRGRRFAVVGVSRNQEKFGNKVYRNLRTKGYTVYAVNPTITDAEGNPVYPSLSALPGAVDGIVLVIPPAQTEKVVREAAALHIDKVWMQPGAESADAISFCEQQGMEVIHDACIMVLAPPVRAV